MKTKSKKMKTLKTTAALLLFSGLAACSSDDSEPAPVVTPTFLVATETLTDMNDNSELAAYDFEYDASHRLVSQMSATESKAYIWGSGGKIVKMTNGTGAAMRETIYTYNSNGALTGEQRNHPASGSVEARYEYTYFSDHYEEKYFNIDGEYVYRNKYYYTPDKKNIEKIENYYPNGDYIGSKEFLYDDKIGVEQLTPYSQLPKPFYNARNAVTQTNRNSSNVITNTSEILLEYDALGHPTASTSGFIKRSFDYLVK